jgi:CubicO group peptidase (beta-lactamase class C family)
MAKSIVSMLIGIAIDEGKIRSVDQLVGDFIPTFKDGKKANITIKHMLTMSSGMGYEESYKSPFSYTAESYYGRHLEKLTLEYDAVEEPGKTYNYLSGNTQILGMILEKSYGKNISELTSEKLWKPMGASQDALWSLDVEDGMEKGFCCYHSNARDFARFGKLFLDSGKFNGIQLISKKYVQESITPADLIYPAKDEHTKYGYQWWLMPNYKGHNIFMMKGHLGQHVICLPKENMIIVRLGNKSEHIIPGRHSPETYRYIDVALEMYGNN